MENKNLENIATTEESLAPKKVRKKLSYASKRRFKHGGVAIAFTAIFVAVVIMLNIGATILAQNVSLTLDLTSNKDFSVSEENKEYVKKIDRKVNIVVCGDKETYQNGIYQYLYNNGYIDVNGSSSQLQQFFSQNVYLLEEYGKLNKNISVEFIDPSTPEFTKYTNRYPDASLNTGNILIESTFTLQGEETNRHRIVNLEDVLRISTDTQTYSEAAYYYYMSTMREAKAIVTGNNIETAITSAIYTVTADRSYSVALVTANGGSQLATLQSYMEMNNYEFTEIKSLVTDKIPENADVVILSQPTHDYSEDELDMIDKYLEFSAEQKKTLMYIGASSQANLPNLNEFLSEWGFSVVPEHTVLETDSEKYVFYPTNVDMSVVSENGYSNDISRKDYRYLANNVVPVVAKTPNDRTMNTVLEISSSAAAVPNDADENYTLDDVEVKGPFVGLGVSDAKKYDSDNNLMTSSVIMLSATDFITTSYNNYSEVGNIEMLGVVIDKVIGKASVGISFDTRTFEQDTFVAPETATSKLMNIIVVWVPVVAVVAVGVIVFIRRRRS